MADSDDEYDRKRRDKFRGERSDSYRSERDRKDDHRGRDDWIDRVRSKPDYREFRGGGRDRMYSPSREMPPMKRMRMGPHDPYGHYGGGGWHPEAGLGWIPPGGGHPYMRGPAAMQVRDTPPDPNMQTQPCMMTLKQFLATQDDSISDSDAITKYNDYKLEFKRQQLNEFFVVHKDEEWFKLKYHPEDLMKRKQEHQEFLQKRIDVFMELMEKKIIADVTLDLTCTEKLLKLLDTVVIKLEGGNEQDLEVLNVQTVPAPVKLPHEPPPVKVTKPVKEEEAEKKEESIKKEEDSEKENKNEEQENKVKEPEDENKEEEEKGEKPKDDSVSESDSSSSSSDSDDDDDEEPKKKKKKSKGKKPEEAEKTEVKVEEEKVEEKDEVKEDSIEDGEEDAGMKENDEEKKKEEVTKNEPLQNVPVIDLVRDKSTVRELHKTTSIFLRNLPSTITKAEVETMCKKYDGFLRVAIADPMAERRWFRRGWVTFKRDANIKEICWNLNNIRLRDYEMGAIMNKDLSRRIRPANGIALHRTVVRNDIKLCARIIHNLDEKHGLWREESTECPEPTGESFGLLSRNPVLQNITDFLIDEASAEEDELLGLTEEKKDNQENEVFDTDSAVIAVLDKLILYLRIIHSVDFYNHCEYPYEDEMPNRCGIIHARSGPPTNRVLATDIQDYIRNFESKLQTFLVQSTPIEGEELVKLGSKNAESEVEKFILANTQELAKDKWLCPLSGKKFKGPEFIRKHILNKHSEKIEEVKKEVEYFNNYLKDPKRPQLPEHPGSAKKAEGAAAPGGMGFRSGVHFGGAPYGSPYSPYPMMAPRPRGGGFPRRGGGPDYRPIIHYRDLDAPREPDEFI